MTRTQLVLPLRAAPGFDFPTAGDGFPEEMVHCRAGTGHGQNLIREQTAIQSDQELIEGQQEAADPVLPECLWEWRGDSPQLLHAVAGLNQQLVEGTEGEQPGVGAVEDSFFAVIEFAKEKHAAHHPKRDVAGGENNFRLFQTRLIAEPFHEPLGVEKMFHHIQEQDVVEP